MLEAGRIDPFEQGFQEGIEIGISEVRLDMLIVMVKHARIFVSEEKWICYKKSKEKNTGSTKRNTRIARKITPNIMMGRVI